MNPKEKAKELFKQYYIFVQNSLIARQCALILVDEARDQVGDMCYDYRCKERIEFWNEVEKELKAM